VHRPGPEAQLWLAALARIFLAGLPNAQLSPPIRKDSQRRQDRSSCLWKFLCKSARFAGRKELDFVDLAEYLNQFRNATGPAGLVAGPRPAPLSPWKYS